MTTIELNSIGAISCRLRRGVSEVLRQMQAMGIEPHTRIDGVGHYTDEQIDRVKDALAVPSQRRSNGHRVIGKSIGHESRQADAS